MAPQSPPRKIFEFLDYREYLQEYYQKKKEANPAFSLRLFSDKIGFKTKDFILRVMKGEKNLSAKSIPMVAKGLGLSKHAADFFAVLVDFNQASITKEREAHYLRMQEILKAARFNESQHLLAHYQYQVYSHWRHLVVRSLIGIHGFSGDYAQLSSLVHPRIKPEEARQSVELLEECGLLKHDSRGHYQLAQNTITTGDRTSKVALQGFHQHCLRLGAESIETVPASERNISGLTLGISAQGYAKIVARLNEFRKEIAQIADEESEADRVYQMHFLLFPFTAKN